MERRSNYAAAVLMIALAVLLLMGTAACSVSPVFYTRRQICEYVSMVYGKEYRLMKIEKDSGEDGSRYYTFVNPDGFAVTITSYTYHPQFDASETAFYSPALASDYKEQIFQQKEGQVERLNEEQSFEIPVCNAYGITVKADSLDELKAAAAYIDRVNDILDYRFVPYEVPCGIGGYGEYPSSVSVFWEDTYLSTVDFTSDGSGLNQNKIYHQLEGAYVNCVKSGTIPGTLSDELWNAYPARKITNVRLEGERLEDSCYRFTYNEEVKDYVISCLDPCQDFGEFPYTYSDAGSFRRLVELLGGTYVCEDWKAEWEIDGAVWKASLSTRNRGGHRYEFRNFAARRNGKALTLSAAGALDGNGTVSGRAFTRADLEQLLGVKITVDQKKLTADIEKE